MTNHFLIFIVNESPMSEYFSKIFVQFIGPLWPINYSFVHEFSLFVSKIQVFCFGSDCTNDFTEQFDSGYVSPSKDLQEKEELVKSVWFLALTKRSANSSVVFKLGMFCQHWSVTMNLEGICLWWKTNNC